MINRLYPSVVCLLCFAAATPAKADEPASVSPAAQAAIDLYDQGLFDQAKAAFTDLNTGSNSLPIYYLGLIERRNGDLDQAAEYVEEAIELDDQQSDYHLTLGEIYGTQAQDAGFFSQMKLARKTKKQFERAVELDGSNLDARSGMIVYYLNAPGIAGGSKKKALEQAQEIARQDPIRGHFELANVYAAQGEDELAVNEYRAAIEKNPTNGDAYLAFGIYLTAEEEYEEALTLYRQRLADQPGDMPIVYQLGRTVSISGLSLDEGEAAFQTYINDYQPAADAPGHDWAHYRLGLIYEKGGDKTGAAQEYQAAMDINPKHPEAKKALKKVSR